MKITLNKEYAVRHLCVATLFAGLALWFLHDAVFVYPNLPADGEHHTTLEFQYSAAALLATVALTVAFRVFRSWRSTLEWTETEMSGSLTGGRPLAFADIERLDDSRWETKRILRVHAKDGRKVTLDAWHHGGARELAEKLLAARTDAC